VTEPKFTPRETVKKLAETIIGQGPLLRALAIAHAYPEEMNVLLIAGGKGLGKTEAVRAEATLSDSIVVFEDASHITQPAYVGTKIEDILYHAWLLAKGNRDRAEKAKIILDEIDKLKKSPPHRGPDVNGAGAQQALLTAIQGTTLHIGPQRNIPFNTRRLQWRLLGAFEGMDLGDDPNWISDEALIGWGLIPQLVDRIRARVQMLLLSREDFRRIIWLAHMPLVRLIQKFKSEGIELVVPDATVEALLDQMPTGSSVRGLQSIIIRFLTQPLLYDLLEWKAQGVTRVEIPPEFVLDHGRPKLTIPPPPPEREWSERLPPELVLARQIARYDEASDPAQAYWQRVERESPRADVVKLAYFIATTLKIDLDQYLHYLDGADEGLTAKEEYEFVARTITDLKLARETPQKTCWTGQKCEIPGAYVFIGWIDPACKDIPDREIRIHMYRDVPFPGAGTRKQPAVWKLVSVFYGGPS
jgi:ATP-dependent protease Clp ATPase subunit